MPSAVHFADSKRGGAWLTIGSFDGVHSGHQKIIQMLVEKSRQQNSPSVVLTFFPHPVKVLRGFKDPFYLTTPAEKDRYISSLGVTSLLTMQFSQAISQLPAYDFMQMLHERLHFSCLLIGYDFHLGKDREGSFDRLSEIGKEMGYCVEAIDPLKSGEEPVSSSRIRNNLMDGNLDEANRLCKRWYELSGEIVHGDGRGRHIGIPTANIATWAEKLIPMPGIYATWSKIEGRFIPGVVNIGVRPTFYDQPTQQTIEVHLFDFDEDIYGKEMRLFFVQRIRDEEKFSSADALMKQIYDDIKKSKEVLANAPAEKNIPA
jgi:riboflavin kinase/FMN adenylyltransferase